jgi:hypothetical protein
MENKQDMLTSKLLERSFVTQSQFEEYKEHQSKGIFSLNAELLFLMYLAVILFTSGIGILIYQNIDSIGHLAIISTVFVLIVVCFYFSYKKAQPFSVQETKFESPIYDYIVLTGIILTCIFFGYIQFQYEIFGSDYRLVSLFSALASFVVAYFFDNRMALSIGLTALTTFIGITLTPNKIFENEFVSNPTLSLTGIALGVLIILWSIYASKNNIKQHFYFVFYTFAQHLIGICCIAGLTQYKWHNWILYIPFIIGLTYYFYKISYKYLETSFFVFTLIYGYIGFNILFFKLFDDSSLMEVLIAFSPLYVIGSILLFIKLVKNFNKEKDGSIQ